MKAILKQARHCLTWDPCRSIKAPFGLFIPEEIQGNWLKTDGSNEWDYGIYDDKVVYNNKLWNNVLLDNKGNNYELTLNNDSQQEKIYLKIKKDKLLIGSSPKNMQLYSRNKTTNPKYVIKNDVKFSPPHINLDTAKYSGYIHGYHPKMGNTGMVYVNNIFTHDQNSHLITINPDGSFYCEVPMIYAQEVYVRMLNMNENIYLEPGKSTFQYIDLSEFTTPYKSYMLQKKRERKSHFMGDASKINADLLAMDSIYYFNYTKTQKIILDMNGHEYKTYCLNIMERELKALNQFENNNQVCKKALQIKRMQIPYEAYEKILSFNRKKSYAYRKKHNTPRNQRKIPLEAETFEPDYYNFINVDDLNNPVSLMAGSTYSTLINRIRFSESARGKHKSTGVPHKIPKFDTIAKKDTIVKIDSLFLEDPKTK
ncbi:MAG: hypothetical protein MI922_13955, partial [Bacteroidales bacterium]|nr:hypothetical protein [Bacteroidales bacterium]